MKHAETDALIQEANDTIKKIKERLERLENIKLRLGIVKVKAIMAENDEAHQVADCQFQDGSVSVLWQGCEVEGTAEAEVGCYKTLGEALRVNPLATPVCFDFDCEPWLACDGIGTQHREGCRFATEGCESAITEED